MTSVSIPDQGEGRCALGPGTRLGGLTLRVGDARYWIERRLPSIPAEPPPNFPEGENYSARYVIS